jgi:thiamine-phosphate pyrophosphorylase
MDIDPLQLDEPLDLADTAEQTAVRRILDAEANRAREALRVVEDYCRFGLDDALLTRELKELRHELSRVLESPLHVLAARDTTGDVGTVISTPTELERHSITAVAEANFKRLEESLRSLEEFSKLRSPAAAASFERLRYRSYTIERAVLLGAAARRILAHARLYVLVSCDQCEADLEWTIQEAAAGGASIFQLREKGLPDSELLIRAQRVRRATTMAGALFIMNDRPDIARLAGADGVHLGQEDLPSKEARRIGGPDMLIGVSTHTIDQVRQAVLDGASYIGVGPTFPSTTKAFSEFPGLDFLRAATAETSLPCFAIGGVNPETIREAVAAGARRAAVSEAICKAEEPRLVAAQMRRTLEG